MLRNRQVHYRKSLIAILSMVLFYSNIATGQKPPKELMFELSTPVSIEMNEFGANYSNPIGVMLSYKDFITQKLAISSSVAFDNFKFKSTGKRTGNFIQTKIGLTHLNGFLNFMKDSTVSSYTLAEFGLVFKENGFLESNSKSFVISIGVGSKKRISRKSFVDIAWIVTNFSEPNFSNSWWLNLKLGIGLYLGK